MGKMQNMRYMRVNEFMVHYTAAGSGPTLILLHGGGTWHFTFRHNIIALSRNFRVYAPDLPGHGYTYPLKAIRHYGFETISKTLYAILEHLGVGKCHLLGHSWGGGWAIDFAGTYPERVNKMVLIASSGIHLRERPVWELLKLPLIGRLLARLITPGMVRKGLNQAFADPSSVSSEMVREIYCPLTFSHVQLAQYGYARNLDWSKTKEALPHIHCPVFILWGREDRYIDMKFGNILAERLPDARLKVLDGCGHVPHEETPDTVNRLIAEFLME